jgi:hypothetical protein
VISEFLGVIFDHEALDVGEVRAEAQQDHLFTEAAKGTKGAGGGVIMPSLWAITLAGSVSL